MGYRQKIREKDEGQSNPEKEDNSQEWLTYCNDDEFMTAELDEHQNKIIRGANKYPEY